MSQDLFAAFDAVDGQTLRHSGQQQQPVQKFSVFDAIDQPSQHSRDDAPGDDWGEFEGPSAEEQGVFGSLENLTIHDSGSPSTTHQNDLPKIISTPNKRLEARDPNILFDACEDLPSEDEDFGDFEGTVPINTQDFPSSAEVDLLGLEDSNPPRLQPSTFQKPQNETFSSLLDLGEIQNQAKISEANEATRKIDKVPYEHTTKKERSSSTQRDDTQKPSSSPSIPLPKPQTTRPEISVND